MSKIMTYEVEVRRGDGRLNRVWDRLKFGEMILLVRVLHDIDAEFRVVAVYADHLNKEGAMHRIAVYTVGDWFRSSGSHLSPA